MLEDRVNDFLRGLPKSDVIDIKFTETESSGESIGGWSVLVWLRTDAPHKKKETS